MNLHNPQLPEARLDGLLAAAKTAAAAKTSTAASKKPAAKK